MPTTFQTAQALHASGYSVIPTKKDKRPLVSWKEYMTHPPEIVDAIAERDALIARAEKAEAKLASAQKGLQSVVGLIMHTKGVVGLHMNGEIAHWVDLLPGGKLSDWLRDFDRALNDSQSPQPKHTI